jgi:uncharacterized flavoprotein (TIGR03862 family)
MKKVVIVGAGPAGLMTAHFLSKNDTFQIDIFDANKAVARKFLVAGHGGFNLSNSEELSTFIQKYNHPFIQSAVKEFTNEDTIQWLSEIGIETFVGSSGKIFPKKGIKPIEVLTSWLHFLKQKNVSFHTEHTLLDFDGTSVSFKSPEVVNIAYDYLIFALGGASWKKTGSTGEWTTLFQSKGIEIVPFEASNAGIELLNWSSNAGGGILKNVQVTIGGQQQFGEIELTEYGLEGAPIYALSNQIRKGETRLWLNLKPTISREELANRFSAFKGNKTDFLKSLKLPKSAIQLIKDTLSRDEFLSDDTFLIAVQNLELIINSLRPIDEAISTVGGISMNETDDTFQLKKLAKHYCIGEMLDWDAPTGGYLLQACLASGVVAAQKMMKS